MKGIDGGYQVRWNPMFLDDGWDGGGHDQAWQPRGDEHQSAGQKERQHRIRTTKLKQLLDLEEVYRYRGSCSGSKTRRSTHAKGRPINEGK